MKIYLHEEISIELNCSKDEKVFVSHINKLSNDTDVDGLLTIANSLNQSFNEKPNAKQKQALLKLMNIVISKLDALLINTSTNKIEHVDEDTNIAISFRHDEGKRMHGAFFDHYLFRKITDRRSKILMSSETILNKFNEFIQQATLGLGLDTQLGQKVIPETIHDTENEGLIVIPGYSRQLYDKDRINFEKDIIKKARLRGQPILAICAGSWTLWNAYGGKVKEVTDHVYSSMPYLVTDGGVGNNKQIHKVSLIKNTIVHGVMNHHIQTDPQVNSVHWMAPDGSIMPKMLEVSARSKMTNELHVINRQGVQMAPESKTVEAFETKYGAPMVGIQWHPECYYSKQNDSEDYKRHLNLINYMVKAGDTFQAKKHVLQELKSTLKLRQFTVFKTLTAMHELEQMSVSIHNDIG